MTQDLLTIAKEIAEKAYAPYSKFRVGSALRASSGEVYKGTNVENASYSNAICAEANAIAQMITAGDHKIEEIHIYSPTGKDGDLCTPCGSCRQKLNEFSDQNTKIHCYSKDGIQKTYTIKDLLPDSFGPEHL